MKNNIIKRMSSHPLMKLPKTILMPIWRVISNFKKKKSFSNNAYNALFKVQSTLLQSANLFYFDFGTLLGLYRDGRLLIRDMDIDVGIQIITEHEIENIRELLKKNNFNHKYIFKSDEIGVIQDTFDYNDVTIDVNYYFRDNDNDVTYMLYDGTADEGNILKLTHKHILGTKQIVIKGVEINVPEDVELYLVEKYGKNWRIPDPTYKYWNNPLYKKMNICGSVEHLLK